MATQWFKTRQPPPAIEEERLQQKEGIATLEQMKEEGRSKRRRGVMEWECDLMRNKLEVTGMSE